MLVCQFLEYCWKDRGAKTCKTASLSGVLIDALDLHSREVELQSEVTAQG